MGSLSPGSPFANSAIQRAAVLSYVVADEVHTLLDQPLIPRRLDPRVRRLGVAGLIVFGTLASTLGKLAYEFQATGRDGVQRSFQKPWFLVLLMFIGMSLNLPLSLFLDLVRRSRKRFSKLISRRRPVTVQPLYQPLLQYDPMDDQEIYNTPLVQSPESVSSGSHHRFKLLDNQILVLLIPTLFDLFGSALLNIGLLAVTASATAMLRQSLLPFAALLGVGLFRKQLNRLHVLGLSGCLVGLLMVAGASLASGFGGFTASPHRGTMAVGISLILASQMVAACQLLIDQSRFTNRLQLSPLKVVGCEGLLGAIITVLLLLLLHTSSVGPEGWGASEDSLDTIIMVLHSPLLLVLLVVYTGSLQAYNICGMAMSGELGAVDTTLLQAVRTLFVWIINLLIFAVATALTPDAADQAHPTVINHGSGAVALHEASTVPPVASAVSVDDSHEPHGQHSRLLLQFCSSSSSSSSSSSHSSLCTQIAGAVTSSAMSGNSTINAAFAVLPGEPWLRWSLLQAGGFVVLVAAAVTYSRGDNERLRRQMEDEAALIMLDQPPSVTGSVTSNRLFTAHMDIDTAAYLRSFARPRQRDMLYGITPVPSLRAGSVHREGVRSSRDGQEGLEPLLSPSDSTWDGEGSRGAEMGITTPPRLVKGLNMRQQHQQQQQSPILQQQSPEAQQQSFELQQQQHQQQLLEGVWVSQQQQQQTPGVQQYAIAGSDPGMRVAAQYQDSGQPPSINANAGIADGSSGLSSSGATCQIRLPAGDEAEQVQRTRTCVRSLAQVLQQEAVSRAEIAGLQDLQQAPAEDVADAATSALQSAPTAAVTSAADAPVAGSLVSRAFVHDSSTQAAVHTAPDTSQSEEHATAAVEAGLHEDDATLGHI